MATVNSTRRPKSSTTTKCSYCQRTAAKTVVADHSTYCGKLCAALSLIRDMSDEEPIDYDDDFAKSALEDLFVNAYFDEEIRVPVRVRHSDALEYERADKEYMVIVDDESPADWIAPQQPSTSERAPANPSLDADQEQIDREVESILRASENPHGEAAS